MNMKIPAILALTALLPLSSTAANWAHWRGPDGNSVAPGAKPPTEWSATRNVKWKVAIPGLGSGSPVIWENRVFVVSAVPIDASASGRSITRLTFKVFCFDRNTGKKLWERTAVEATPHQRTHTTNGFASASPCTDGERVYAHFGSRGLYCYTLDGRLVWKRDDFGRMETRSDFGEGSSPTLAGNKILVPWDHEGPSALYALDRLTGRTIWKADRDEPTNWSTPHVVEHNGRRQVVVNGENFARSYDLETGRELWRCGGQTQRPVACAVSADGLVVVGSGFRGNYMGAFRLGGKGDIQGTKHVVWELDRNTPDIASPLLSNGRVYFHKGKSGMLSCVDLKTGRPHYSSQRIQGIAATYASPVAANGHVYLTGRRGTTVVIKDSDKLEIVASNSLGETVDATPAPVDNQLFIRGEKHLFCIAE
jgi:outer membrane protein assembly factor BamB